MPSTLSCDLAIVGGGLAGSLIALALHKARPDLDLRLIEAGDTFGGNHLWSFFGSDVSKDERDLLAPLVAHAWPAYDVRFPAHARTLAQPYYTIPSTRLDAHVRATLPEHSLMTGQKVLSTAPTTVVLADGDRLEAKGVIDARGPASLAALELGWQKFVGTEVKLDAPHGLERPVVMDATVMQLDGYRFVYTLPFSADTLLIEDTYYSDAQRLEEASLAARVQKYAADQGWTIAETLRTEKGVLPVALGGDFDAYWRAGGTRVAKAGVRAGLFHPTTGYSLPDAVRTAHLIARASDLSGAALHDLTYAHASETWKSRGFYRMLDRMLFLAARPDERYRVLERFYGLKPDLIARFYAARSTDADKLRVLAGKPPVPVFRALGALKGKW